CRGCCKVLQHAPLYERRRPSRESELWCHRRNHSSRQTSSSGCLVAEVVARLVVGQCCCRESRRSGEARECLQHSTRDDSRQFACSSLPEGRWWKDRC